MVIGLPKEIKDRENRVAATPSGVRELASNGHQVLVESGAGVGSGFADPQYVAAGAQIVPTAADAWAADMVIKVKEPQPSEYEYLRPNLLLFTYLHLAAAESLTHELVRRQVTGIAYETVELPNGTLPLLTPMSEVAGRMATQMAAYYLMKPHGGLGKLPGGVPGVLPARFVILGGGVVGINAAKMALGLGAAVLILDTNLDRLRYLDDVLDGRFTTQVADHARIAESVRTADVVIGAVLVKGARAPHLVTREMISTMQAGSVVVDVAVDQGGCIETTRATTHSDPVYTVDNVVHYCVANMPGAVPHTSTIALSNATVPYMKTLANLGAEAAIHADPVLAKGLNTYRGAITYPAVAEAFGLEYVPFAA